MKPSFLLGSCVALWGVVSALPTIGMIAPMPWLVWLVAAFWGVVYAKRNLSARLALIQGASVVVAALVSGRTSEYFAYALVIPGVVVLSIGYLILWMAPFGIADAYIKDGSTRR